MCIFQEFLSIFQEFCKNADFMTERSLRYIFCIDNISSKRHLFSLDITQKKGYSNLFSAIIQPFDKAENMNTTGLHFSNCVVFIHKKQAI